MDKPPTLSASQVPSNAPLMAANIPLLTHPYFPTIQQQQQHHPQQHHHHHHPVPQGDFRQSFFNPYQVKHRRRTTKEQYEVLEGTFRTNPKPSSEMRRNLASRLSMTAREVQIWFQNRRAKAKNHAAKKLAAEAGVVTTAGGNERPTNSTPTASATETAAYPLSSPTKESVKQGSKEARVRSKSTSSKSRTLTIDTPSTLQLKQQQQQQQQQQNHSKKNSQTYSYGSGTRVYNSAWDGSNIAPLEDEDIASHTNLVSSPERAANRFAMMDPTNLPLPPGMGLAAIAAGGAFSPFDQVGNINSSSTNQQQQQQQSPFSLFNMASAPCIFGDGGNSDMNSIGGGQIPSPPYSAFPSSGNSNNSINVSQLPSYLSGPQTATGVVFPHTQSFGSPGAMDPPALDYSSQSNGSASSKAVGGDKGTEDEDEDDNLPELAGDTDSPTECAQASFGQVSSSSPASISSKPYSGIQVSLQEAFINSAQGIPHQLQQQPQPIPTNNLHGAFHYMFPPQMTNQSGQHFFNQHLTSMPSEAISHSSMNAAVSVPQSSYPNIQVNLPMYIQQQQQPQQP
ncbi:hypothetical protein H4219_002311 [Mycoemilia scoparia]|uniref:Homeobox domain-containing protein n=1 Tax=Mycoemilia scoparia TaxID=417184 RepID=A0A9W8A5Z9_9FUNG|nr:hypothetical protein H4219_002311 [Mycoemilia scoparia]